MLYFFTTPNDSDTSTTRMVLTHDGKVGVGTSSPWAEIDLHKNTNGRAEMSISNVNAGTSAYAQYSAYNDGSSGNIQMGVGGTAYTGLYGDRAYVVAGTGTQGLVLNAEGGTNPMIFATNSTERMRIANGGNVGIGTTAPNALLDVNGTVAIDGYAGATRKLGIGSASSTLTGIHLKAGTANWYIDNRGTDDSPNGRIAISTGASDLFTILTSGNVGIGVANPSHILHIAGQGRATATSWTTTSDIRLKDIESDYTYGLNEILQLHTVHFRYKKDNPLGLPSDKTHTGVIAQELQKVIPEAVEKTDDGYLTVNVDPVHWAVINAIKELFAKFTATDDQHEREIASLKEENSKLKSDNEDIKVRLERLEQALQESKK
jgi:hypothetical protein